MSATVILFVRGVPYLLGLVSAIAVAVAWCRSRPEDRKP